MGLCDYVKLDVFSSSDAELKRSVDLARRARVCPIAGKVENVNRYKSCRALGFDFFQGFFLADPQIAGDKMPVATTRVLELLRALHDPRVTIEQLEDIVRRDVLLSYRLVRCLNSAAFGCRNEFKTFDTRSSCWGSTISANGRRCSRFRQGPASRWN